MRILIVEDDSVIADAMRRALARDGHAADIVGSAGEARTALHAENFDLMVLDIGLPREDGLALLRELRRRGTTIPILMLTARDGLNDRVAALDLGADDYLTKPFQVSELLARIRALLRRAHGLATSALSIGRLELDLARKEALVDGEPVELTQREWAILEPLALNAGHLVSKQKLMSVVSGWGEEITPNAIEVYVSRLRTKLAGGVRIQAVRGLGYRLDEPAKVP
jgi:DNA-binding response OmpR family regulator